MDLLDEVRKKKVRQRQKRKIEKDRERVLNKQAKREEMLRKKIDAKVFGNCLFSTFEKPHSNMHEIV